MIPKNITRKHVIKALQEIDRKGVPKRRQFRDYILVFNGKYYPPKYAVSLSNKYANDNMLNPSDFGGGVNETNRFLGNLGFKIIDKASSAELKITSNKSIKKTKHNERCSDCKNVILEMLRKIYGKVMIDYDINASALIEDYKNSKYYKNLKEILSTLEQFRGNKNFAKLKRLHRCDFFVTNPKFIVELDESQHFTEPRKLTLIKYPKDIPTGFDRKKWIEYCEKLDRKDSDPKYKNRDRDERRAWYDTLRDFIPVIKGFKPTVRLFMGDLKWCSLNPEKPEDVSKFRKFVEYERKTSDGWVATVILESNMKHSNNKERLKILSKIIDTVMEETEGSGVILFPGGWFTGGKQKPRTLYKWAEKNIKNIIRKNKRNIIICVGMDGRVDKYAKDQISIAIDKNGIIAIGRKFHPIDEERGHIEVAENYLAKEEGKSRIFDLNGKRYFICVCYDVFGISHLYIPNNLDIDIVLVCVHEFNPPSEGVSGTYYFARDGFARASEKWKCPVYGAAVFFNRKVSNWPSGVLQTKKVNRSWKYLDNSIKNPKELQIKISEGIAIVRIYGY